MKQLGITLSLALFLLGSIANPSFAFVQSYEADNNEFVNILVQNNDEDDDNDKEGDKKSSEKGDNKEGDKKDKAKKAECEAKKAECKDKKAESKKCCDKKAKEPCKTKSSPTEN